MCAANVRTVMDPASNKKPDKKHAPGRIDGAVVAMMMLAAAPASRRAKFDAGALIG
jgi:phage terminase large subunit-like protein